MINEIAELEKNIFYRLIKVIYISFLIIFLSCAILEGYSSIPTRYVDTENSYLICENNLYLFRDLDVDYWTPLNKFFNQNFDKTANQACETNKFIEHKVNLISGEITSAMAKAELQRREMVKKINPPTYELSVAYKTSGSWKDVLYCWLLFPSIIYICMNIVRETLIYIAFGKKFDWGWCVTLFCVNYLRKR